MMPARLLLSTEVPQSDSLASVRRVLQALADGAVTTTQIAERTGLSARHVGYGVTAARVLGFLADDGTSLTVTGGQLLASPIGAGDERACFRRAIAACEVVQQVAPELFEARPPTREVLARRIFKQTAGLGKETARRRAQTLLAWRSQVLEVQLPLFPKPRRKRAAAGPRRPKAEPRVDGASEDRASPRIERKSQG